MDRFHIQPDQIYNLDETGMTPVQTPRHVLAEKSIKQVGSLTSAERGQLITLICVISATGNNIPPLLIFPRVNFKDHFIRDRSIDQLELQTNQVGPMRTFFMNFCSILRQKRLVPKKIQPC